MGQQNLVLLGDFNYPDTCWENNMAAHKLFITLLGHAEDLFLLQMLDVPIRINTLLGLLLTD